MTAREITETTLRAKQIENPDPQELRRLATSAQACLQSGSGKTVQHVEGTRASSGPLTHYKLYEKLPCYGGIV